MTTALNGPRIKLRRARALAADLQQQIEAYLATQPFAIEDAEEEGTGDLVYIVRVRAPVPEEFGAVIGDVIHNARAALDLLIWQAVEANGGTPGKPTCFPIAKDEPSYQKTRANALAGASADVFTLMDGLKPYAGGNDQLWRLHNLDILDKHRVLVPVGAAHRNVVVTVRPPGLPQGISLPPIALRPQDRLFPLLDGTVVFRVCASVKGEDGFVESGFTFEIAFGDGHFVDGQEVMGVLDGLVRAVERVVDFFETHIFGGTAGMPPVPLPPKVIEISTNTTFTLNELQVAMRPGPSPDKSHPVFAVTSDGVKHLCLFTTEGKAAPFLDNLKARGILDAAMFHSANQADWIALLEYMGKQGISYVSLDSLSAGVGQLRLIPIPEMIRTIRMAADLAT
jgi:hypothetical protein